MAKTTVIHYPVTSCSYTLDFPRKQDIFSSQVHIHCPEALDLPEIFGKPCHPSMTMADHKQDASHNSVTGQEGLSHRNHWNSHKEKELAIYVNISSVSTSLTDILKM